jgi:hypothetical protein
VAAELIEIEFKRVAALIDEGVFKLTGDEGDVLEGSWGDEIAAVSRLQHTIQQHHIRETAANGSAGGKVFPATVAHNRVRHVTLAQPCMHRRAPPCPRLPRVYVTASCIAMM